MSCTSSTYSNSESWLSPENTASLLSHQGESCTFSHISQTSFPRPRDATDTSSFHTAAYHHRSWLCENPLRLLPSASIHLDPSSRPHLLTALSFLLIPRECLALRLPFQSPSMIWAPLRARSFAHTTPTTKPNNVYFPRPLHKLSSCRNLDISLSHRHLLFSRLPFPWFFSLLGPTVLNILSIPVFTSFLTQGLFHEPSLRPLTCQHGLPHCPSHNSGRNTTIHFLL